MYELLVGRGPTAHPCCPTDPRVRASAHLASIRGYYRRLLVDPAFVDRLYQIAAADPAVTSLADQKVYVDRITERLRAAIDPANAPLKLTRVLDAADADVQRLIPYGGMDWVLALADLWLRAAGISAGPVLRGFQNQSDALHAGAMTPRTFERLLAGYPIPIDGALRAVRPHDLRRTYARLLYEAWVSGRGGLPLEAIQQNMGHRSIDQTRAYVRTLDAGHRRPGAVLSFDFTILRGLE